MTNQQIIMKLIGDINPIGKTEVDEVRFENLSELCNTINQLLDLVYMVAVNNKDSYEYSRKRASDLAIKFLKEIVSNTPNL